tara:strand:+ start:6948 stop:7709 length:762 start_codon:yes stop_codon:yes gene_type:complete
MGNKKDLKTMDLDDLEADYDKSMLEDEEIILNDGIDVNDLDLPARAQVKPKVSTAIKKFDPAMHAQRKKLNAMKGDKLLNHLTQKFRFDRAKTRWWVVLLIISIIVCGYFVRELPSNDRQLNPTFDLIYSLANLTVMIINKVYIIIAGLIFFFVPMKALTPTMIEVFYDGLTLPHEVLPIGAHMRRRIQWRQIKHVKFKTKRLIPMVQLYGAQKQLLGEIRLDVDDVGTMYECIDMYAPKDNPIRMLFENKKS